MFWILNNNCESVNIQIRDILALTILHILVASPLVTVDARVHQYLLYQIVTRKCFFFNLLHPNLET